MANERTHHMGLNGAVAAVLRGELAAANLTQKTISERSGISLPTIQRYLAGTRAIGVDKLEEICAAIGVEPRAVVAAAAERLGRSQSGDEGNNSSDVAG